jgi:hypothetical protein
LDSFFATLPADDYFWWCLGSATVAAAGFVASFVFLHRCRLMENMPTSRLRSAAQGYIELEGQALLANGPPIIAPLTKTDCIWWRFRVEKKVQSGKNTKWVTVRSGTSDDCFELDDGTGKCMVDPDGATVIPSHRERWYGSSESPDVAPKAGGGWLRAGFSRYRYTEERLHARDSLYALGGFRTQAGGPEPFDEDLDLKELLAKWKHDKKMMALFDTNKDGTIDSREWEAARRMATRKVRDEHVQRAVGTPDLHILAKPKDSRPYILSGVPQARLIQRYRVQSAACIGAAVLGGFVLLEALMARGILG